MEELRREAAGVAMPKEDPVNGKGGLLLQLWSPS